MVENTENLLDRIRDVLHTGGAVREVRMFGGLCFMVNEKMVVGVMGDGALLVRADPDRSTVLLAVDGARQAEMGAGRSMGPSWISVAPGRAVAEDALDFWMTEALTYNSRITEP